MNVRNDELQKPTSFYTTRPDVLLHLEGLLFLIAGCVAYGHLYPGRWGLFALLFLAPDFALLPYMWAKGGVSATIYNIFHSYLLPLGLGLFAWARGVELAGQISLIWLAHISFDRLMGYGLKYPGEFRRTHIQRSASA
jgi:hypothetical protein